MTHPALQTRFTELVGVQHPIVQTGMGWVAGPRLVAATANAGALGIIAGATMSLEQLTSAVREVKDRTGNPFGVNLRADAPDAMDRAEMLIKEGVKVASFALAPDKALIQRLKDAGIVTMPSVGAKRHAEKVAQWGVDAVIVQGGEGGGHTGSVPTTLLLPSVVDAVGEELCVVAAGGFFDGRGLVAALAYGAQAVAMGTRFLLTKDSTVGDAVKDVYLQTPVTGTVVTTQVDGVPHRVLRTELVDKLERLGGPRKYTNAARNALRFKKESGTPWSAIIREGRSMKKTHELSWSQVIMAANTPMLLKASMVDGRPDLGVMSTGQVVGLIEELPTVDELVTRIITEATEVLSRLR
ncbi:MAG TPA: nitronate monooxygenase family protein [Mycobacteriales bacterium]|nr:nitronate monooxygenase family protein [Mycobacteriales bacterium]